MGGDFGSVWAVGMPAAGGVSIYREPFLFPSVVPATKRRPVSGVGSSVFGVLDQVIGFTLAGGHMAAHPHTFGEPELHGVSG